MNTFFKFLLLIGVCYFMYRLPGDIEKKVREETSGEMISLLDENLELSKENKNLRKEILELLKDKK